ncbi:MAG: serine/threonine protein phosphatase [Chlamydiae bacterium]|nr:serine/threonine protein phosphatase [Chlamydiota bacterium]
MAAASSSIQASSSSLIKPVKVESSSLADFTKILSIYNDQFAKGGTEPHHMKIEVSEDSVLIHIGDLHGQLGCLNQLLNSFKGKYIDETWDVLPECRGKIKFIFHGDYVDRGPFSWETLKMLIIFKMKNPQDVILLRGNHDDIKYDPYYYPERDPQKFCSNPLFRNLLTAFFQSLPMQVIVSCNNNSICCSHGSIDLYEDLDDSSDDLLVPVLHEDRKCAFSDRITNTLLPDRIGERVAQIPEFKKILLAYITEQTPDKITAAKTAAESLIGREIKSKEAAIKMLSAINIYHIAITINQEIADLCKEEISEEFLRTIHSENTYWGDPDDAKNGFNTKRNAGLVLTPAALANYATMVSGTKKIVGFVFGHRHFRKIFPIGGIGLVHTLAAADPGHNTYLRIQPGKTLNEWTRTEVKIDSSNKFEVTTKFIDPKLNDYFNIEPFIERLQVLLQQRV